MPVAQSRGLSWQGRERELRMPCRLWQQEVGPQVCLGQSLGQKTGVGPASFLGAAGRQGSLQPRRVELLFLLQLFLHFL